ncbi:MAG: DUF2961 domain-containing protein [Spirochaetes bacterium]|uniref:DUF2961 domain-containing protein n=1 Tax=Candidatus Ornithospirochaeta stercoripullorum TaxID=2840899 RepID=A0A9D9H5B0_9SPIO|nr:DUF2961 domain-containing protein [Candidatus Ornithospirochaeta stercoripullorum]
MSNIFDRTKLESRAITAENRKGEKGRGGIASSFLGPSRKGSPCLKGIKSGETVTLCDINGPGMIRHIWMTVDDRTSDAERFVLRDIVLRMYWDGEENPSVEVPLGDFFLLGFGESYTVDSALISVIPSRGMNSYIQMPFRKNAVITIENQHRNPIPAFFFQIDYTLGDDVSDALYFHASWRRERYTEKRRDYTVLDGVEGDGVYLGTFICLSALERYWWGEGEFKFFIDGDDEFPTICGTGMEDYFGGSWSFAGTDSNGRTFEKTYCTPYLGYPFYSHHDASLFNKYHNDDCPPMRAFYRWHLPDPIYFHSDLKLTVQQIGVSYGGLFERQDDLSSVAYWYQSEPHKAFRELLPACERWPR